jgi:hypothetical protein
MLPSNRVRKRGSADGRPSFRKDAGGLGESPTPMKSGLPLPGQACPELAEGKGVRGMVEGVFHQPAKCLTVSGLST